MTRIGTGLAVALLAGMIPRAQAVSTYACTSFPFGGGSVFTSGINNLQQIAGTISTGQYGFQFPFFVDKNGVSLPLSLPPFAANAIVLTSVNNQGQVAGYGRDTSAPPSEFRSFVSNPDGTYSIIDPPANTDTQSYRDLLITSITDSGELAGTVTITGSGGTSKDWIFRRDTSGVFHFVEQAPYGYGYLLTDPAYRPKMNNSEIFIIGDLGSLTPWRERMADGYEAQVYEQEGYGSTKYYYGMNDLNRVVGVVSNLPIPIIRNLNSGEGPALVCPELRAYNLKDVVAYSINDRGVIAGSIASTGDIFIATPTGAESKLQLSNTSWGFSPNPVGEQGGSGTIYISSTGAADLNIAGLGIFAVGRDEPQDFSITENSCTGSQPIATLSPGQFCAVSFTFRPTGPGARTAQIVIYDDAPDAPHVVRLSGTGLGRGNLQISNGWWSFNPQPVGLTSNEGIVYIYNPGTDVINFSSIAISGGSSTDFSISTNTCGAAITPYTTCAVGVQFNPQAAGLRNSTLVFTDNSGAGRQAVALAGAGF